LRNDYGFWSLTGPNGAHFSRSSFASKTSVQSLSVETGTNGIQRLQLRGYQNDPTQALTTVTEAAVKAAIDSAK
jgi:hypothetical protein